MHTYVYAHIYHSNAGSPDSCGWKFARDSTTSDACLNRSARSLAVNNVIGMATVNMSCVAHTYIHKGTRAYTFVCMCVKHGPSIHVYQLCIPSLSHTHE